MCGFMTFAPGLRCSPVRTDSAGGPTVFAGLNDVFREAIRPINPVNSSFPAGSLKKEGVFLVKKNLTQKRFCPMKINVRIMLEGLCLQGEKLGEPQ